MINIFKKKVVSYVEGSTLNNQSVVYIAHVLMLNSIATCQGARAACLQCECLFI
jgi:hypothetical protein